MVELTTADLVERPSMYESSRALNDVLIGEDAARPLIEASSSGDDKALRSLLSQRQWIKIMLEEPHCIYSENQGREGPNDVREVLARRMSNLVRAVTIAAENGHADVLSTLFAFAETQSTVNLSDLVTSSTVKKTIQSGNAAAFRALASAHPSVVKFPLGHGILPLYEAVKLLKHDIVVALLELGADPQHSVESSRELTSYNSSLLSLAAKSVGPHITELLLQRGVPVAQSGAMHTAAAFGRRETIRLLLPHGNINETLPDWSNWTPLHFAAANKQTDTMKLLEDNGAWSDVEDEDGKTPAQLLEEGRAT